jgi:hypothetical protein
LDPLIKSQLSRADAARQLRSLDPRETPVIHGLLSSCRELSATRLDTTRHSVCVTPALPHFSQIGATIIFQLVRTASRGSSMARALTIISVEKASPSRRRVAIPDGGLQGLYLVIQPSGAKSWAYRYRLNGKTRKYTRSRRPHQVLRSRPRTIAPTKLSNTSWICWPRLDPTVTFRRPQCHR